MFAFNFANAALYNYIVLFVNLRFGEYASQISIDSVYIVLITYFFYIQVLL